jgi:putative membrane protein
MLRDRAAHARVESAIAALEEKTDARVLLAFVRSSGSYRDVDHVAATLAATVVLVSMLFVHFHGRGIDDHWILTPVVAAYVGVAFASARTFGVRRLLTSVRRRGTQVANAARATFVEERLHGTRQRSGILLYISWLEREVEIVPDLGIEGRLETAAWNAIRHDLEAATRGFELERAVLHALAATGKLLAEKIPRTTHGEERPPHRLRVRV